MLKFCPLASLLSYRHYSCNHLDHYCYPCSNETSQCAKCNLLLTNCIFFTPILLWCQLTSGFMFILDFIDIFDILDCLIPMCGIVCFICTDEIFMRLTEFVAFQWIASIYVFCFIMGLFLWWYWIVARVDAECCSNIFRW